MGTEFSLMKGIACPACGAKYDPDMVNSLCRCGSPLYVTYDLEMAKEGLSKNSLGGREGSLWRYHELLPVKKIENVVSLGEGMTPLLSAGKLGSELGVPKLMVKDEGIIPTGTFKARGAAAGVSKAKELGIRKIVMPTNGNAGAAWALYAARAGIDAFIIMPESAPKITMAECVAAGARLFLVDGLISDAGQISKRASEDYGLFDVSTLKEPYRVEGKKTMGLEILEELSWNVPDVILYPTGGGVGLIGIYKAISELREMGWVEKMPRLVAVQADGCQPVVRAWEKHATECEFWNNSRTVAFGINVPKPLGDRLVLDALYKSGGYAIAVTDDEILEAQKLAGRLEGMFMCPEGASTVAAVGKLRESGWIENGERVVALNTGAGLKYPETVAVDVPHLKPSDSLRI